MPARKLTARQRAQIDKIIHGYYLCLRDLALMSDADEATKLDLFKVIVREAAIAAEFGTRTKIKK
jgi:hypothetical protein